MKSETYVIPATPGYYCVYCDLDEVEIYIDEAVLAWHISSRDGFNGDSQLLVRPIHSGGIASQSDIYIGFQLPNGKIEVHDDRTYDSIEQLKEVILKRIADKTEK